MKSIYIGKKGNGDIAIAPSATNKHILICGNCGSGKSVRLNEIEQRIVLNGGTVLAIDINGTHSEADENMCNRINVCQDGLSLRILDKSLIDEGVNTKNNMIAYAAEVFSAGQGFGGRQLLALRDAIEFAIDHASDYTSEMMAIKEGLLEQQTSYADAVYEKLWFLIEGNYIKTDTKKVQEGKLNIISFKGISPRVQRIIIEIYLKDLWMKYRRIGAGATGVTVTLDEFQNLSLNKDSVLSELLRESRKYNLNIVLATQTLSGFNREQLALIHQAAVKLFFCPNTNDLPHIAKTIEIGNEKLWESVLGRLSKGQAVALGELVALPGNENIRRPVLTKSEFK